MALERTDMDRRDPTVSSGSFAAISPNDSQDILVTRGIYVGGGGSLRVIGERDTSPTDFLGAVAGSVLPIRVRRVHLSGTTATGLVALY